MGARARARDDERNFVSLLAFLISIDRRMYGDPGTLEVH